MSSSHTEYLEALERRAGYYDLSDFYLWPRTPIGEEIQARISERVGASDYEVENSRSRPARIIRQIKALIKFSLIPVEFSVLDIACGDAIVLWQIKKTFPQACVYGVDCNKGNFTTHDMVQREGVRLYKVYIQHLFRSNIDKPFDLMLMLNTYRGWESADLRGHEYDLKRLADAWFEINSLYSIVTAKKSQILYLQRLGFKVMKIGKGEDKSTMICMSKRGLPLTFWRRLFPLL